MVQMWPFSKKELLGLPRGWRRMVRLSLLIHVQCQGAASRHAGWAGCSSRPPLGSTLRGQLLNMLVRMKNADTPLWDSEGMRWTRAWTEQSPRGHKAHVATTKATGLVGPRHCLLFSLPVLEQIRSGAEQAFWATGKFRVWRTFDW